MVGIRVVVRENESENSTYQHKPLKAGPFRGHLGYKWVDIEVLDWDEEIQVLDIETRAKGANGGSIGYWVSSKDVITHSALDAPSFEFEHRGDAGEYFVDQKIWEFGEQPRLRIYRPNAKSSNSNFTFSILARPVLASLGPFKIKVQGIANPDDPTKSEKVFDDEFEFTSGELQQKGDEMTPHEQVKIMKHEFERFCVCSADNLVGDGNIVHPKQYLTIRGLEYVLNNYIDSAQKINLAYIGTDTTENLRSIVRWLMITDWSSSVESLTVFYTTQWDRNFLKRLELERDYQQRCPELNIKFLELSEETIHLQKQKANFDIILATYVAPWAIGESRKSYRNLLDATMGPSSYLVSIDPQDETSSVRSELTSYTNSHDLYDILQMSTAKPPDDYENNSVEWSVWKKNRMSTGGAQ